MVDSVDVVKNVLFVFCSLYVLKNCGIFGSKYHESGSVDGVHTCGEYCEDFVGILYLEIYFAAVGSADPVLLHQSDLLRPSVQLTVIQVLKESVCVISDLEVPLAQVLLCNGSLASLADAVNYLLVGKYGLAGRTPVNGVLLLVCQSPLIELDEYPLHPAVIVF